MSENYIMPVRAIKRILGEELDKFKAQFFIHESQLTMSDVQQEMLYIAESVMKASLESCTTYAELDDFLSYAGYRMSLQEWVQSL